MSQADIAAAMQVIKEMLGPQIVADTTDQEVLRLQSDSLS